LGPLEHDRESHPGQGSCSRQCRGPRRRRCLLKGCEQFFEPRCTQARYCSPACQRAAERWRRWRAGQTWRKTEGGRQCRRRQSCRYRERVRQRREAEQAAAEDVAQATCEGQRPAEALEKIPCARPGCYELFVPAPRSPQQRFCSCLCRQALRRVLQREARWGRRRKRGPRSRRRIPPWRTKVRRRVL
jgi:hypothetical protein